MGTNDKSARAVTQSRPSDEHRGLTDAVRNSIAENDWLSSQFVTNPRIQERSIPLELNLDDILEGKLPTAGYDPRNLLGDSRINPTFSGLVKSFLEAAIKQSFRPIIFEAYRTRQRSQLLYDNYINHHGPKAALISFHNFGMAVDVQLLTQNGQMVSFSTNGPIPFATWKKFIKIGESVGLINGERHNDTDHYEYHPLWNRSDWVNAGIYAQPIYNATPGGEMEKLKAVWKSAGL